MSEHIKRLLLVKYAEIHLKGQNRPMFQRVLVRNIKRAVASLNAKVKLHDSRIFIADYDDEDVCIERVRRVFGVHAVCPTIALDKDMEAIKHAAADMMSKMSGSFKVQARRADKSFPLNSPQINKELGSYLLQSNSSLVVDVHKPQHILNVEIRDCALLYVREEPGVGGLPTGSSEKAMLLLSGGIDSPVAGYRIAKRGVEVSAVYFHSFPYTGEPAKEKVLSLAKVLSAYTALIRLYIVSFTEIQQTILKLCPEVFTTLLMRRCMMRIAERLAISEGAKALITGESIGQVASQTLDALVQTNAVVEMPVFRPLIGMDKLEIIKESKMIGTYEISCLPYDDCCTVFTPRHPVIHPKRIGTELAEKPLLEDGLLGKMIETAVLEAELQVIKP
jgi:thiamine biosynthesis protein ThiI